MPTAADPRAALAAAAPAMSRRHAAGAASARGILFTVLGEFVLPGGTGVWTAAVIDVLARLGVEEKAARQALMRTAADGWLSPDRHGRRTRWRLTAAAERLLTDGSARIYGFGAGRTGWDGSWLLVLARTPEAERPARYQLRTQLSWAGFGSPAPGVWISTHCDRLGEAEAILARAGLAGDAHVFSGSHRSGELPALVSQAWDLTALARRYEEFTAAFAAERPADPLAATIELVHAWRRFPWTDPDLPQQLLPRRWAGTSAAALFRQRHAQWSPAAIADWQQIAAGRPAPASRSPAQPGRAARRSSADHAG